MKTVTKIFAKKLTFFDNPAWISTNLFNGVEKYYEALVKKEQKDMLETLTVSLEQNENENLYQKNILYFKDLTFTNNIFLATYESKDKNISIYF